METATDGKSENCQAILLDGFDEAYGSLGLIVRIGTGSNMAMLSDVYYADGKNVLCESRERNTGLTI